MSRPEQKVAAQSEGTVCKRCKGTRIVDDGEITGEGGCEFSNGPIKRVTDCPDCVPTEGARDASAQDEMVYYGGSKALEPVSFNPSAQQDEPEGEYRNEWNPLLQCNERIRVHDVQKLIADESAQQDARKYVCTGLETCLSNCSHPCVQPAAQQDAREAGEISEADARGGVDTYEAQVSRLRRALRPFADLATPPLSWAMVEHCIKDDPEKQTLQRPQMQRAFNRAAQVYAETATAPVAQQVQADAAVGTAVACWTSVEDALPTAEKDYLVKGIKHSSLFHDIAGMFHGKWMSQVTQDDCKFEVTHWMPLPAAAVGTVPGEVLGDVVEALRFALAYIAIRHGTPDPTDPGADQTLIAIHAKIDAALAKVQAAKEGNSAAPQPAPATGDGVCKCGAFCQDSGDDACRYTSPSQQAVSEKRDDAEEALHYLRMGIENLTLGNGVHMVDFRNAERYLMQASAAHRREDQRVLTYDDQPGNVEAWRIGEACCKSTNGGDFIDRGLSLLQQLQVAGFGVVRIDAAMQRTAAPAHGDSGEGA